MSDGRSYGLRELAHRYYTGELSFESYRRERTQLLDRLTLELDDDASEPVTQPMLAKPGVPHASGWRRVSSLLMLIVLIMIIIAIIWMFKPEWFAFSRLQVSDINEIGMLNSGGVIKGIVNILTSTNSL